MLTIYNTLSQKKEKFKIRQGKKINLFVCGPTVYDFSHLGHARTYVAFDMIVKYLRQKGYEVFYLQNITDIDDKIINRAKEKNVSPKDLARQLEKEYLADMSALKINSVTKYARATEYIPEIISQIQRLFKKGFAYKAEDGIYYDISKFKDYGKLSKRTALQAEDSVSRIDDSIGKKNKGDFCLWKFSKPNEPQWPSPWGLGRPGWHIEDTAITEKYFGPQYDIHGGARDLIFPHHEAEIAQMEAISGKSPLVFYWLHTGFLTISGQKMSKSLGNFITIKDFLKIHTARILRLFALKSHYRSPIDYSKKEIDAVKNQLERIDEFINKLQSLNNTNKNSRIFANEINDYSRKLEKAIEDDFNTPKAMAVIFDLINKSNSLIDKDKLALSDAGNILKFFEKIDSFFGFIFPEKAEDIPEEVKALTEEREKLRQENQWQKADKIRQKINDLGYLIEDTKEGTKIKKA